MTIPPVPGFDALQATPASRPLAGQDVLSAPVTQGPTATTTPPEPSGTAPATTENPCRSAYDQIMTASSVALMQSLSAGAGSPAPQFADGSPASTLSGISTMMDALKAGMAQGMFAGTGFDHEG